MTDRTCLKCLTFIASSGDKRMNYCLYCGSPFPIDATGEQPFHLPESDPNVKGMVEKSIKDIDILLGPGHPLPLDLIKALNECRDILIGIHKHDRVNRDETREMLKRIKVESEREERAWLDDDWFDKLKKLKF